MTKKPTELSMIKHIDKNVSTLLARLNPTLEKRVTTLETQVMALTADIQKLIDDVAVNKDGVDAALAGLAAEATQITDLKQQIADLVAAGGTISAEDLAAVQASVATLEETNTKLQTAVPAGT